MREIRKKCKEILKIIKIVRDCAKLKVSINEKKRDKGFIIKPNEIRNIQAIKLVMQIWKSKNSAKDLRLES